MQTPVSSVLVMVETICPAFARVGSCRRRSGWKGQFRSKSEVVRCAERSGWKSVYPPQGWTNQPHVRLSRIWKMQNISKRVMLTSATIPSPDSCSSLQQWTWWRLGGGGGLFKKPHQDPLYIMITNTDFFFFFFISKTFIPLKCLQRSVSEFCVWPCHHGVWEEWPVSTCFLYMCKHL